MADGLGRAMLRSTMASLAGIMAMDLYFSTMKKVKERRRGGRAEVGGPERRVGERTGPVDPARAGDGPEEGEDRPWHVEEHRAAASQASDVIRGWSEAASGEEASESGTSGERMGDGPVSGEPAAEAGASSERTAGEESAEAGSAPGASGEGNGRADASPTGAERPTDGESEHPLDDISLVGQTHEDGEPATVAAGRIVYERLRREEPSREKRAQLGRVVHWGYGMAVGSLFALVDRKVQGHDLATGLGYGTALWLLGDELAVPMLGLADGPTAHSPGVHAEALGAHLVYGLTTSAANRALRRFV